MHTTKHLNDNKHGIKISTQSYIFACSSSKICHKIPEGTLSYGIKLTSKHNISLEAFVKFTILQVKLSYSPTQTGGHKTQAYRNLQINIFKSCSISRYLIWLGGPLFWISKRQSIIAYSTVEAEVYVTKECT